EATNIVLTKTNAFIDASTVNAAGDVSAHATNSASIIATVVSASAAVGGSGEVGVGASIGVAVSRNQIGDGLDQLDDGDVDFVVGGAADTSSVDLVHGDTVKIKTGVRAGDVFQYIASAPADDVNLGMADFADSNVWKQINLSDDTPLEVQAYTQNSS